MAGDQPTGSLLADLLRADTRTAGSALAPAGDPDRPAPEPKYLTDAEVFGEAKPKYLSDAEVFGHDPAPVDPTKIRTGKIANIGAGANEAISTVLGLPGDVVNAIAQPAHVAARAVGRGARSLFGMRALTPEEEADIARRGEIPGGSADVKSGLGVVGMDPRDTVAITPADRVVRGMARVGTEMAVPTGIARAIPEAAVNALPPLARMVTGTVAAPTVRQAATMGATGELAREASQALPEARIDLGPGLYASTRPITDTAAMLAGGSLPALATAGTRAVGEGVRAVRGKLAPLVSGAARERAAAEGVLARSSEPETLVQRLDPEHVPAAEPVRPADVGVSDTGGTFTAAERQAIQAEAARREAEAAATAQRPPVAPRTTAEQAQDPGIAAMARGAEARPTGAPFKAQRALRDEAIANATEAVAPEGNPAAVTRSLRAQLDELNARHEQEMNDFVAEAAQHRTGLEGRQAAEAQPAQAGATASREALGNEPGVRSATDYGAEQRGQLEAMKARHKAEASRLWDEIDPGGDLRIDAGPLRADVEGAGRMPATARPLAGEEAAIFETVAGLPSVVPFQDITALRSRVLAHKRALEATPGADAQSIRRMAMVREAIDRRLSGAAEDAATIGRDATGGNVVPFQPGEARAAGAAVSPGAAIEVGPAENFDAAAQGRYRAASDATRETKQTFGGGAVGETLREQPGGAGWRVGDAEVAGKFFRPGPKAAAEVERFRAAAGSGADRLLTDYAAWRLRSFAQRPDGTIDPAKFQRFMTDHADALRPFPEARAQFRTAAEAQRTVDEMMARHGEEAASQGARVDAEAKALGAGHKATRQEYERGAASYYLDGTDPVRAIGAALKSPADTRAIVASVSHDHDALLGLRRSTLEHIQETWKSGKAFADNVDRHRESLRAVFGEDGYQNLRDLAAEHRRSLIGPNSKTPGSSGTAQDAMQGAARQDTGSVLGLLASGGLEAAGHTALGGTGIAATILRKVLGDRAQVEIDRITNEILLDPLKARELLIRASQRTAPRQEATLRRLVAAAALDDTGRQPTR